MHLVTLRVRSAVALLRLVLERTHVALGARCAARVREDGPGSARQRVSSGGGRASGSSGQSGRRERSRGVLRCRRQLGSCFAAGCGAVTKPVDSAEKGQQSPL